MSKNIDNLRFSTLHKYYDIVEKIKEDGVQVFDLNSTGFAEKTNKSYYQALKKLKRETNSYGDYRGLEELRKQFSKYYNEKTNMNKYNASSIQITLGASDAIISLLMCICNFGDTILVLEPFFCDYRNYCEMLGLNITYITIDDLKKDIKIPENCKAILFSNPNNPSGNILNKKEMEDIINIAIKNDLYIISDEVYSELVYEDFISFAVFEYEKIIIVDSVSKKFNNGGARIGAIITRNENILSDMAKIYDSRISISNTEQIAIANMFRNKKRILDKNLKAYNKKVKIIENFLEKQNEIEYEIPKGGVFFLLTLPGIDTDLLAEWILKSFRKNNKTVLILPTSAFYCNNKEKIRLSITKDINTILEGLKLLLEAIKAYKKQNL